MIVFLDVDKKSIDCYTDNGKISIPFREASKIYNVSKGEKIYYITNAVLTTVEEILGVVSSFGVDISPYSPEPVSSNKYIHSVTNSPVILMKEGLRFEGKFDIKLYDKVIEEKIKNSNILQNLIKNKKLKIIGENERNSLLKEKEAVREKRESKQKTEAYIRNGGEETKIVDGREVIEIDLSRGGSGGGRIASNESGGSMEALSEVLDGIRSE